MKQKHVRLAVAGTVLVFATGLALIYQQAPVAAQVEALDHKRSVDPSDGPTITLPDFRQVAKRVVPSVVTVRSEKTLRQPAMQDFFGQFFGGAPLDPDQSGEEFFTQRGLGSGVIVSADGYVLTNNHVVEGVDRVEVVTVGRKVLKANVVGTDPQSDLAVIKVDAKDLEPVKLGDSDALDVGEWVLAIGNPFSERLGHTVTAGIVSAKGRSLGMVSAAYEDFIQTDAAINPGNSGGALVNSRGDLVGINTAIMSRTGGYQGVGFAIPVNQARRIMQQLIDGGRVRRGYLGVLIQDLSPDVAEALGMRDAGGALITEVQDDTPAKRGGLLADDVIVELDGRPVQDSADLRNQVASRTPGTTVAVVALRGGERKQLSIGLEELPGSGSNGTSTVPGTASGTELGLSVEELTPDVAKRLGFEGREGVIVQAVESGSGAARAGIERGDLIVEVARQEVRSVRDFRKAVTGAKTEKVVLLKVRRGGGVLYVAVRP